MFVHVLCSAFGRAGVLAEPSGYLVPQPAAVGDASHVQARLGVGHPAGEAAVRLHDVPGPRDAGVRRRARAQQVSRRDRRWVETGEGECFFDRTVAVAWCSARSLSLFLTVT